MKYEELSDFFHQHAQELTESKSPTAKFRSASYERVAVKLQQLAGTQVTDANINDLDISTHMKDRAKAFMSNAVKSPRRVQSKTKPVTKQTKSVTKKIKPLDVEPREKTQEKTPNTTSTKDSTRLTKELVEFMGIGETRAKKLIESGVRSISQLHQKKYRDLLPEETKAFIDLKPVKPIPREHITALVPLLTSGKPKAIIVGSYRRERPSSSDIDVLIESDDADCIQKYLKKISKKLNGKVYPYSKGVDKLSMIVDTSDLISQGLVYKIDAFRVVPEEFASMLLYSTGSKEFNVEMRSKAKKLGYKLNQRGLFDAAGERIPLETEEDYFKFLKMPYKTPRERI